VLIVVMEHPEVLAVVEQDSVMVEAEEEELAVAAAVVAVAVIMLVQVLQVMYREVIRGLGVQEVPPTVELGVTGLSK
jgi:hypothetical protein